MLEIVSQDSAPHPQKLKSHISDWRDRRSQLRLAFLLQIISILHSPNVYHSEVCEIGKQIRLLYMH